jgi:hypothetical protein
MRQGFKSEHWSDENGNPSGGVTTGNAFTISWQHGPLGRDGDRKEPNGSFVEDIIAAAIDRLEYYQQSRFACVYNADAIDLLKQAIVRLEDRTRDREKRAVEGTHGE